MVDLSDETKADIEREVRKCVRGLGACMRADQYTALKAAIRKIVAETQESFEEAIELLKARDQWLGRVAKQRGSLYQMLERVAGQDNAVLETMRKSGLPDMLDESVTREIEQVLTAVKTDVDLLMIEITSSHARREAERRGRDVW